MNSITYVSVRVLVTTWTRLLCWWPVGRCRRLPTPGNSGGDRVLGLLAEEAGEGLRAAVWGRGTSSHGSARAAQTRERSCSLDGRGRDGTKWRLWPPNPLVANVGCVLGDRRATLRLTKSPRAEETEERAGPGSRVPAVCLPCARRQEGLGSCPERPLQGAQPLPGPPELRCCGPEPGLWG